MASYISQAPLNVSGASYFYGYPTLRFSEKDCCNFDLSKESELRNFNHVAARACFRSNNWRRMDFIMLREMRM